jgi:hypothetical protein
MASFDINTRMDLVKRRSLPVTSGTYYTGRWCTMDANGNAAAAVAGSRVNMLIILGNEKRPDSIGSSSITVQYGENLYTLNTWGVGSAVTAKDMLKVDSNGDLIPTSAASSVAVAIAESTVANSVTAGLQIRSLF